MLLGRGVWTRGPAGWRRKSFEEGASSGAAAVAHLADCLSGGGPGTALAVFEPEGIGHQAVETPRVGRAVFATLERVRNEHAAVTSETLGWGIEMPEPAQGGAFSTLMHYEMAPGLVDVCDTCDLRGARLAVAWSAYTAAVFCMKPGLTGARTRFSLVLVPGFAAVSAHGGGRRSFRSWVGPMSERDWKAFSALVGDMDARTPPSMSEAGLRRGGITVIADGDPGLICPIWGEMGSSGRVEAVLSLDALADSAARLKPSHPANLVEAFPRPRQLNRYLVGATAMGLTLAVASGASSLTLRRQLHTEDGASRGRTSALQGHLAALERNQGSMRRIREEMPEGDGLPLAERHDALAALAAAVPETVTLTSLTIARDSSFEIQAMVVGSGFDMEGFRAALNRGGFTWANPSGCSYDASSCRLLVSGRYGWSRP